MNECKMCNNVRKNPAQISTLLEECEEVELVPHPSDLMVEEEQQRWLQGLVCQHCGQAVALLIGDQVRWLDDVLEEEGAQLEGWRLARGSGDRWRQMVLNNIVFHTNEPPDLAEEETDYSMPESEDQVWLCWDRGRAVGFCTLKLKGCRVPGSFMETYQLDIVDSVFIRKSHRRRGFGTKLLGELMKIYPSDLGFSRPTSKGMIYLLLKIMKKNETKRDRFWLCSESGGEGDKNNIWLSSSILNRKRNVIS